MKTKLLTVGAVGELIVVLILVAVMMSGSPFAKLLRGETGTRPGNIKGIVIHYKYNRTRFFPKNWLEDPIHCDGTQVDLAEAERVVPLIEEFASVYDGATLRENLSDIYLLDDLNCYGKPSGGTTSYSAIYLHVPARDAGIGDESILAMLHDEFSMILLRNYNFSSDAWKSLNGKDFEYANNTMEVLGQPGLMNPAPEELLKHGLLTRYSTTEWENDFGQYAGWLFVWPETLCKYRLQYDTIAHKADLAIEFYKSFDPKIATPECK